MKEFTEAMEYRWGNAWQAVAGIAGAGATKWRWTRLRSEREYIIRRGPRGDLRHNHSEIRLVARLKNGFREGNRDLTKSRVALMTRFPN